MLNVRDILFPCHVLWASSPAVFLHHVDDGAKVVCMFPHNQLPLVGVLQYTWETPDKRVVGLCAPMGSDLILSAARAAPSCCSTLYRGMGNARIWYARIRSFARLCSRRSPVCSVCGVKSNDFFMGTFLWGKHDAFELYCVVEYSSFMLVKIWLVFIHVQVTYVVRHCCA